MGQSKLQLILIKKKNFFWDTLPNYLIELPNSLPYHVPQFVPLPLAQAKNGDNQSSKYTHEGFSIFHLGDLRGGFFSTCSRCVLIMFPWGFPTSQVFPKDVPNSTSVLSHYGLPKVQLLHVYKLKKCPIGKFLFCN